MRNGKLYVILCLITSSGTDEMKIVVFALFLATSSVTGAVAQTNIFKPGKVYTYDVTSTFWPDLYSSRNTSGIEKWKVRHLLNVTAVEPNKIVFQSERYRLFRGNKATNQIPISASVQNELETPIEVTLDAKGQPISLKFQHILHESLINMKKIELSHFILNTETFFINDVQNGEEQLEYVVQENSILGQCEVKYIVNEEQTSLLNLQSNSLSQNATISETKTEFTEDQPEDDTSRMQQQSVETSNGQLTWSSDKSHHVESMPRFCDINSTIYEFRKVTDFKYCQIIGNFKKPEHKAVMVKTQYITCGRHRERITVLQISNEFTTEDKLVDKISLVDISDISGTKMPSFQNASGQITNFYISSFEKWYDFKTTAFSDIEKFNPAEYRRIRTQTHFGQNIRKFRTCIHHSGTHPSKLVLRNLNSKHYNHLNLQWNLRIKKVYPLAYFLPTTAKDVAKAVKCGLDTEIRLVPNGGGHSYEAIGWGNNDTVVVDFRNMNKISIVRSGPHAIGRIEAGALLGPTNAYFWENGGYAVPMGACMTVGIGGHAIGGGAGYFSNQYGLTIDNVVEYEMVDGRGQIVVANHQTNSDLFWALRGVASGYIGIMTSIKVKLFDAKKIKITLVRVRYKVKHFAPAYIAFQNMLKWIKANEPAIHLEMVVASDTYNSTLPNFSPGIEFIGIHVQDPYVQPKGNASFLKALFKTFPKPDKIIQEFPNYIQSVNTISYTPQVTTTLTGASRSVADQVNEHSPSTTRFVDSKSDADIIAVLKSVRKDDELPRYLKSKSFFIKKYFTLGQMKRVAHVLRKIPSNYFNMQFTPEYGGLRRIGKNETAYVHRDSILIVYVQYEGPDDPVLVNEAMTYLYKLWKSIQFMDGGETYQNSHDFDVQDYLIRFYGQNLDRLIEQKQKWDPTNFFKTPLSLPKLR